MATKAQTLATRLRVVHPATGWDKPRHGQTVGFTAADGTTQYGTLWERAVARSYHHRDPWFVWLSPTDVRYVATRRGGRRTGRAEPIGRHALAVPVDTGTRTL